MPINKQTENIFIWVVVTKNRDIIRISPALWERLAQSPSQISLDQAEYRGRPYSTDEQNFVWAKGKINQTSYDRKVRAIIVAQKQILLGHFGSHFFFISTYWQWKFRGQIGEIWLPGYSIMNTSDRSYTVYGIPVIIDDQQY